MRAGSAKRTSNCSASTHVLEPQPKALLRPVCTADGRAQLQGHEVELRTANAVTVAVVSQQGHHAVPMHIIQTTGQVCSPRLTTLHHTLPTLTRPSLAACCHRPSTNVSNWCNSNTALSRRGLDEITYAFPFHVPAAGYCTADQAHSLPATLTSDHAVYATAIVRTYWAQQSDSRLSIWACPLPHRHSNSA